MKLKEITAVIENFAPLSYQESYDNAGLICGDPEMMITGAVICLDSTEEVLDEAIALGANLVIAHHPIVFSGLKKFTGKNYVERIIIKAIRNNIAIYAAHTNMDNVHNGVNAKIAEKLGLVNGKVLLPQKGHVKKLVTFCPEEKAEDVRDAMFRAGAGTIGEYEECSFNATGTGTFLAGKNANPYVGEIGKRALEKEIRIELIYPAHLESKIVSAMIKAHPYEEVAYDLFALDNTHPRIGSGLVGELKEAMEEKAFLSHVKKTMQAAVVRHTKLGGKAIRKVALCGGSGSFLLPQAIASGADVFISADFKYHQFFDADNQIVVLDIGHYETEHFTGELFYGILKEKFSTFALHLTKINTNPINYL
jgi:dinuclear metal center YbgI/SA1388 family protein